MSFVGAAIVIASADVVIFANDVGIRDKDRFAASVIFQTTPKQAIKDAKGIIEAAQHQISGD